MKIYLGTDHAGFFLKEKIKEFLLKKGYTIEDCGAYSFDKEDDYPDFIAKAAAAISRNPQDRAIVFGGSGQGEAMLANKFPHVRAGIFYSPRIPPGPADKNGRESHDPYEMIRLIREHNDSNILSLGARLLSVEEAIKAVVLWLETPFLGERRHARRIEKMENFQKMFEKQ
jgi:ribose 5-phosphate isomerase B